MNENFSGMSENKNIQILDFKNLNELNWPWKY